MEMKVIKSEKGLCTCCMEEHEVKTVLIKERTIFKNVNVNYDATYLYCDLADELYANDDIISYGMHRRSIIKNCDFRLETSNDFNIFYLTKFALVYDRMKLKLFKEETTRSL